jgi:group I intron endonuclease
MGGKPIYVRMAISGIYSITNTKSGRVYYGSSNDVKERWRNHRSKLGRGIHPNPHLQNSWNKYGADSFEFKIEEEIVSDKLQDAEQCYLDWCKLCSFWSYNIGYDAECATRGMKFGPPSEEHRRKIGLANSGERSANFGKKLSAETRRKMSEGQRGNPKPPRTEEHRKHLSEALKGRIISENTILANSRRFSGVRNPKYDPTIYTFSHPVIGVEKCTQLELRNKYNLRSSLMSLVLKGRRKSHRGWKLYE